MYLPPDILQFIVVIYIIKTTLVSTIYGDKIYRVYSQTGNELDLHV